MRFVAIGVIRRSGLPANGNSAVTISVTAGTNPGGMLNISRWCKPPVIPGDKIVPSPGRGVVNQSRYVIDTPESALSRRFRNEKPRANDPTGMAWRLARVPRWNRPRGERNCRKRRRRLLIMCIC